MAYRKMEYDPDDEAFWKFAFLFPKEQDGFQSLADVVLRVGRVLYQEDWDDMDAALSFAPSPVESRGLPHRLTREMCPNLSDEEFLESARAYDFWWEQTHASATRFSAVKEWIVERCASGQLKTGLRGKGGPITELAADIWKTDREYFKWWFARCEMSVADPYCQRVTGPDCKQIFVLKTDVDSAIGAWMGQTLIAAQTTRSKSDDEPRPLTTKEKRRLLKDVEAWLQVRLKQSPNTKTHTLPELTSEALTTFKGLRERWFVREVWPKIRGEFPAWAKQGKMNRPKPKPLAR
jgi:hypothetical protein